MKNNKGWLSFWEKEKAKKAVAAVLILGIALLFLSEFLPEKKEESAAEAPLSEVEDYVGELESKLEEMVKAITGEEAHVVLTAEAGYKSVLAQEDKEDLQESEGKIAKSKENQYTVIRNADGSQSTVQLFREEPQIRGVVVLCQNGENSLVKQQVISAVTTVLHISSARVCVLNVNGGGN